MGRRRRRRREAGREPILMKEKEKVGWRRRRRGRGCERATGRVPRGRIGWEEKAAAAVSIFHVPPAPPQGRMTGYEGRRSRGGSCSAWGDGSGKKIKSGGGSRSLSIMGPALPSALQHHRYGGPGSGATTASGAPVGAMWTARRPAFSSSGANPYI
nr:uncharacterized protein LOC109780497 [Aegilops tauschii subsp. strangulata]